GALATLAVHERETSRYLWFDDDGLVGREDRRRGVSRQIRPPRGDVRRLAFAGIHVCSPRLLDLITERRGFSIVDGYLRLASEGHAIAPWRLTGDTWLEVGNAQRLEAARATLERNP